MHTNNSKNEKILKEEKMPFEDSSLADEIELEETQSNTEESEEAEIVEEVEPIELLESEKEKDMNKKMKKLQEENTKLENEIIDFKDKFLRTMAEYENFRKRTVKEKEGIYTDACTDVLKEVLPVLDNLERALSVEGCGEDLRTGVEMTVRQFNDAFSKLGVEELPPEGEFDPNFHNAVMHIEDEQYGTNQIVEVFQKGYKRANKVLRHSMVKVAN
ncbi:nucleotide exchange factor GrpE [Clostridium tagluense]|nr:nucleotide exchange factor GrpE [Clostridium sp. FP2]MCB2310114.1 nucleotide exchange factor GrpE [Clostridium tagluense]MCB2314356.1 nucleotide exchange factor GrpE [Clostridium tagluense]MCB2319202.1 nucleotide exchange factor GrpE [Clostridium tagluense]MCB2324708.1 nucleotide exchange factor GrpE [Clostridium tagluense]